MKTAAAGLGWSFGGRWSAGAQWLMCEAANEDVPTCNQEKQQHQRLSPAFRAYKFNLKIW